METYCRDLERERERLKWEDEWEDEWVNEQYILKLPEVQEDLEADLEAADLETADWWELDSYTDPSEPDSDSAYEEYFAT